MFKIYEPAAQGVSALMLLSIMRNSEIGRLYTNKYQSHVMTFLHGQGRCAKVAKEIKGSLQTERRCLFADIFHQYETITMIVHLW